MDYSNLAGIFEWAAHLLYCLLGFYSLGSITSLVILIFIFDVKEPLSHPN